MAVLLGTGYEFLIRRLWWDDYGLTMVVSITEEKLLQIKTLLYSKFLQQRRRLKVLRKYVMHNFGI